MFRNSRHSQNGRDPRLATPLSFLLAQTRRSLGSILVLTNDRCRLRESVRQSAAPGRREYDLVKGPGLTCAASSNPHAPSRRGCESGRTSPGSCSRRSTARWVRGRSRFCGRRSTAGSSSGRRCAHGLPSETRTCCWRWAICTSRTSASGGTRDRGWSGASTTSTTPASFRSRAISCGWRPAPCWRRRRRRWTCRRIGSARCCSKDTGPDSAPRVSRSCSPTGDTRRWSS